MSPLATTGLVARAVIETLDSICAPDTRDRVLSRATRWSRGEVPERGPEVAQFIEGALFQACDEVLGPGAADAVREELRPLGRLVRGREESTVRRSSPSLRLALEAEEERRRRASSDRPKAVFPAPSNDVGFDDTLIASQPAVGGDMASAPTTSRPVPKAESSLPLPSFAPDPYAASPQSLPPFGRSGAPRTTRPSGDTERRILAEVSIVRTGVPLPTDTDRMGRPGHPGRHALTVTEPAPVHAELPLLLVASSDPSAVHRLNLRLGGHASVLGVGDPLRLLELAAGGSLLVLDLARPSVRPETLVALEPELPPTVRVVLWGDEAALRQRLTRSGQTLPRQWVCASPGDDAVHSACRRFLR